MDRLNRIKECVFDIDKNKELISLLYKENETQFYKMRFAYLAYIDGDKKLPLMGLFSNDSALAEKLYGLKEEIGVFLKADVSMDFYRVLFFLDVYRRYKIFEADIKKIYARPKFHGNPVLSDVLKDSHGYILWHYQLEGLISMFINSPDKARDIRKGLNRKDPGAWQFIKTLKFTDGRTLFDVYGERGIESTTNTPQYREAYNLFNLIAG